MRVYRDIEVVDEQTGEKSIVTESVYDLMEVTYNGQDMSKRVITATIKSPDPIGFQLGDYVVLPMQSLDRDGNRGSVLAPPERYYIYTEPQCKKTARKDSTGDAFEITVNFYPRQYELSCIMMRDFIQKESNDQNIIYTGFDTVSFYGGASELLRRCKACLDQYYKDPETGEGLWNYDLDPSLNEDVNMALERYAFSFSGNSVMDALLKLNDKDYINTTFYINGRTIYVGKKRPYLCAVNSQGDITNSPLRMTYGKTSHMPIDIDHGGLFNITKSVGEEVPITKLFAYGAARNLNRYYCADRLHSGRFVNKLMLPSFSDDGETDYIISEESAKKYGINEGCKNFEEIYPSLRYMTYADIRGIKYCIKVRTSGLETDQFIDGKMEHTNDEGRAKIPMARVQCYKVTPCEGEKKGRNMLVECAPPEDLVIFIHATGKTVKCVLYGGATNEEALAKQQNADGHWKNDESKPYRVPTRTYGGTDYIPGSCFAVHDIGFVDMDGKRWSDADRQSWFEAEFRRYSDTDSLYPDNIEQQTAELHRIEYVDTFWLTDLYVMEYENGAAKYDAQRNFPRDGYSAWAWPRLNNESIYPDSMPVNEVVAVEPIVIADTSDNINAGRQQHWDIYLRDLGFAIDEQNDFGEMVFVFATPVISVLDGILAGREFTIDGGENLNNFQERVVCAYNEDGSFNYDFMFPGDSGNEGIPQRALQNGAVWRIRLNRNDQDSELSSVGLVIPNVDIHMNAGDHIVLLDIYMPDIYIRAAEQRLLREAQEYLDKNDKGNVKYSINLDQVRFNQIRNYALQMREGVRIRMQDDDLNITSQNKVREIVDHKDVPNASEVPMYTMVNDVHEGVENTSVYTYYSKNSPNEPKFQEHFKVGPVENARVRLTVSIPKSAAIAVYDENRPITLMRDRIQRPYYNFEWADLIDRYSFSFDISVDDLGGTTDVYGALAVTVHELITYTEGIKEYPQEGAAGAIMPAITNDYVRFKAGKYYDVVVDVHEDEVASESSDFFRPIGTHGPEGHEVNNDQIVLTPNKGSLQTNYSPGEYTKTFIRTFREDGRWLRRYKYSFYLPDSFTEGNGYYVGFYYFTPDNTGTTKTDFSMVRMVSVTESDLNERGEVVNYVDFLVSNVTIKIQDNTRPADTRIMGVSPEAIYTISAQIEEQTKASAWGTLMNNVEKTRIEQEQTKRTYEAMANIARQNYQNLLNLRNNIFDPDGTCNDVFLQVMMLQVGADSMNFQLDYTFTTPTGVMNNFTVSGRDTSTPVEAYDHFKVFEDDVLHHFVYTQGAGNAGTWQIPGKFDCPLAPIITQNEQGQDVKEWPVYYVCIRCKKDSVNDLSEPAWICSTKQYAVNDETNTDYWYFNWGILTADSDGHYTLQETRGNAYMYGDNIICGKISTLAGNSYFDLTHGNFVLAKDAGSPALSYINGVLTISGINDGSENSILVRLGLTEGVANGAASAAAEAAAAASAAQQAANAAQQAVDNVTNDGIISKGTEKQELNREFIIIAGSNRDGEGTDGSYYKNTAQADEYGLDHSALDDAFEDLYAAMKVVLGTSQSTGKIDGSKMQIDTYIGGLINNVPTYQIQIPYGANLYTGNDPLTVTSATNVFTSIQTESGKRHKIKIDTVSGNARVLDAIYSADGSVETFTTIVSAESGGGTFTDQSAVIVGNGNTLGFRCGADGSDQSWELTGINIRKYAEIGPTEFNALWKNYYDAEVELLNRISNAIDEREIGGENLSILDGGKYEYKYTSESGSIMSGYIDLLQTGTTESGGTIFTYLPAGKYVFSAKEIYGMILGGNGIPVGNVTYTLEARKENDGSYSPYKSIQIDHGDNVVVRLETEYPCTFRIKYAYGISQGQTVSMRLLDVMLQRGTKPTSYQDYVKHLADALHGSTEIAGGITMTNLLMLKDEDGRVKAGMSGLTDDNGAGTPGDGTFSEGVTLWSGGTYAEALQQAKGLIHYLPILLTKTGVGSKLGCFEVVSTNSVAVYGEDRLHRILLTSGLEMSLKMQEYDSTNGEWKDQLIISNEEIDSKYIVKVFAMSLQRYKVKTRSEIAKDIFLVKYPSDDGTLKDRVYVEANSLCDISPNVYLVVSVKTSMSGWMLSEATIVGKLALVQINNDGTYTNVAQSEFTQAGSCNDGNAMFTIQLTGFSATPYTIYNDGNYGLRLTINYFNRTNGAGVTQTEHMYNDNWEDCEVYTSINTDIHFSKRTSEDRTIMRIGRNGMLIAHSASSYFLARNDAVAMNVEMGGLPTQPDSSKPNSLYKGTGGVLMIN